ncbi:unnamed protein product, partial [Meganyctiphanes norvegica]
TIGTLITKRYMIGYIIYPTTALTGQPTSYRSANVTYMTILGRTGKNHRQIPIRGTTRRTAQGHLEGYYCQTDLCNSATNTFCNTILMLLNIVLFALKYIEY